MPAGSATSRSRTTRSATCFGLRATCRRRWRATTPSLAIAERLAKADPGNAGWQRDLSVSHDKIGDVLRAQGNLPGALESYRASLAISERLAKADPGNAGWQRDLSVSHEQDRRRAAGPGQPAGGAGELPRRARHRRAAGQGRPRQCRLAARPLGVAQQDRRRARDQGNLPAALESYRAALAISERLAKADPGNAGWQQRPLGVAREDRRRAAGSGQPAAALESYRAALAIAERLAKADPGNAGWQRDLSVSHDKIGDVLRAQGNLPRRWRATTPALAIAERLAKADPGNAGWQRDLSVSHRQDRRRAAGSGQPAGGAGELPRRARHRRTPRRSRPRQCRLAARPLGVAQQDRRRAAGPGQPAGALASYRPRSPSANVWPRPTPAMPAGSATSRCRTARSATCCGLRATCRRRWRATGPRSPLPSVWPRPTPAMPAGSAISRCRTTRSATCCGLRATCRGAGELPRRARHRRTPGQGRPRQCRLAARPLGFARQHRRRASAQGNLPGALESYRASLAIAERLAKADPGNAGWQHDLALSLQRVGFMVARQGEPDAARIAYERGHEILRRLVGLAPDHAALRRDLAWFEARLAELKQ